MDFYTLLDQVIESLRQRQRVTYRALQRQFELDDETLNDLKDELLYAQQPVLFVMEDLHWVDPTTLEFLSLLVDQGPTARILALCTFRPDFSPPWTGRSHLSQVTLPRVPRCQAAAMTGRVTHGKALPAEVMEQVMAKTDGVPLFVEELTKMVLKSSLLREGAEHYEFTGPLAQADACIAQGFPTYVAVGMITRGWALVV